MPNKNGVLCDTKDIEECDDIETLRRHSLYQYRIIASQVEMLDQKSDEIRKNWSKGYMNSKFKEGDKVIKIKGYNFTGIVVSIFKTTKNEVRYVIECTIPGVEGLLHIYNGSEFELIK